MTDQEKLQFIQAELALYSFTHKSAAEVIKSILNELLKQ